MQQPRNAPPSTLPLVPDGADEPRADCHALLERLPDWAMVYVRDLLRMITRLVASWAALSLFLG